MFKKSLASVVSAAVLVAGPGHLTLTAAAQTMNRAPVTGVSVTPSFGAGLNSPSLGASSFNAPALAPGALLAPGLTVAPAGIVTAVDAIHRTADGRVGFHYTLVEVVADVVSGEAAPADDIDAVQWVASDKAGDFVQWEETLRVIALARAMAS